jgi:hypothetical protein
MHDIYSKKFRTLQHPSRYAPLRSLSIPSKWAIDKHCARACVRNTVSQQQRIEVRVQTLREVVGEVIRCVMHRNRRCVRRRRRRLARGIGKGKARAAGRRDAHGSRGAGPGRAAGALGCELPVGAVDFVSGVEEGVGCACVGGGSAVPAVSCISPACSFAIKTLDLRSPS